MARELNEKQIQEIKELLLENKAKIQTTINGLVGEHEGLSGMDLNDEGDFAAASRDYNTDIHLKKQQLDELKLINLALDKIQKGVYTGLCDMCDSEIGMKRLRVKPHARYCIDCRTYIDSSK